MLRSQLGLAANAVDFLDEARSISLLLGKEVRVIATGFSDKQILGLGILCQ
jgi:hypothetical protein